MREEAIGSDKISVLILMLGFTLRAPLVLTRFKNNLNRGGDIKRRQKKNRSTFVWCVYFIFLPGRL